MSYPQKLRPTYEEVRWVRMWDLELQGLKFEINISSVHSFLPINSNPRLINPLKQYYRVPVNKELLTGTVPVNNLIHNG